MIRVEVPNFRRCCFCIPLRYGLLATGYARLTLIIILLMLLMFVTTQLMFVPGVFILFVTLGVLLCLTDIGFSVVFVIGAHKKHYKLLRVYYYFCMASLGVSTLIFVIIIGLQIYTYSNYYGSYMQRRLMKVMIMEGVFYSLFFVFQGYLILLIRSEVLKLKGNGRFEFVNNAAEAECRLDVNDEAMASRMQPID